MEKLIETLLDHVSIEKPLTLVDVGSMGGPEPGWRDIILHGSVRMIGFEPDEREFAKLHSDTSHTYFPFALYSKDEVPLTFYVTRDSGKSSIFRPNMALLQQFPDSERFSIVDTVLLPSKRVRTLDTVIFSTHDTSPDFLKLDTEGSELFILEGARRTLKNVFGVKVEVEFSEFHEGQPLFSDVDRFLKGEGFELMDLRRAFWKRKDYTHFCGKGMLIFGDALYMQKIEFLFNPKDEPIDKSKILKAVIICLLYGMRDRAYTILNRAAGVAQNADRDFFQNALRRVRKDDRLHFLICRFFGPLHLGIRLNRVAKYCSASDQGFSDADQILGN